MLREIRPNTGTDESAGLAEWPVSPASEPWSDASEDLRDRLQSAVEQAQHRILSLQRSDGHWCAELQGDTILESEYILLLHFLARGDDDRVDPELLDAGRVAQACEYLRSQQLDDGGWSTYPGGPADASPSVKAYFALKLGGDDPDAPHMRRARERILELGGIDATNSFTKIYLAIFGQWDWRRAPAVPPELILMPTWFYVNIYDMSSWSRAIVVPLAMIWALKPRCVVPEHQSIRELSHVRAPRQVERGRKQRFWAAFFRLVDRGIKGAERLGLFRPFRATAMDQCKSWIEARLPESDGLAAIFPPILNVIIAYRTLGYAEDHPIVNSQLEELRKYELVEGGALRLQPCLSPVWDTSLSINALLESGIRADHPAIQRAALWILEREVRQDGDWKVKNPELSPGGWYFEYANEFYPDCDDTAEILAVFSKLQMTDPEQEEKRREALERALRWQCGMQNDDGGWGAFDRECNKELLELVPFADHNAMIDPSTADITARTIEALIAHGHDYRSPEVHRALRFLCLQQEPDGCWYGRWGINYIYGTWLVLGAMRSAGVHRRDPYEGRVRRAVDWLIGQQNEDGGWGESPASYEDPSTRGVGSSTAAQTGWAMMGILAVEAERLAEGGHAFEGERLNRLEAALRRGCEYLLDAQTSSGCWDDAHWTGTGFPTVFYLRYHYYDHYFPLQALAAYSALLERMQRPMRQ